MNPDKCELCGVDNVLDLDSRHSVKDNAGRFWCYACAKKALAAVDVEYLKTGVRRLIRG